MNAVYVSIDEKTSFFNENIRTKDQPALSDSLISSLFLTIRKVKWVSTRDFGTCSVFMVIRLKERQAKPNPNKFR